MCKPGHTDKTSDMLRRVLLFDRPGNHGDGYVASVAEKLGYSHQWLRRCIEGSLTFPPDLLSELYDITQNRTVFDLLLPEHAYFVSLPPDASEKDVYMAETKSIKEDAGSNAEVIDALSDGRIEPDEIAGIVKECSEAIRAKLAVMMAARKAAEKYAKTVA